MRQEVDHIKSTVVLALQYFQCLHLLYCKVTLVQVSSEIPVWLQIIPDPENYPDFLSISYENVFTTYPFSQYSNFAVMTLLNLCIFYSFNYLSSWKLFSCTSAQWVCLMLKQRSYTVFCFFRHKKLVSLVNYF